MAGTKRKASSPEVAETQPKKAMVGVTIPTNKTMPTDYSFIAATPEGCLKLVSYNVNSVNAACKKGFKEYLKAESPDVICLQETKANQAQPFLVSKSVYPFQYWHCSKSKKGYAGTAVFSKVKPVAVTYGLEPKGTDTEGRVINVEFASFHFVGCYVPNAGEKLVRLDRRMKWDELMNAHLAKLEMTKPVVYSGDLNVAHHPVDLARPDSNKRSAGFTIEERDGFTKILESAGRVDTFRKLYPGATAEGYTYFGYRAGARNRGVGWRLDYFVVSGSLMDRVHDVVVRNQCYGASDHVPLVMYLKRDPKDSEAAETAETAESEASDKDDE